MKRYCFIIRPAEAALLLLSLVGCGVTKTPGPETSIPDVSLDGTPPAPDPPVFLSRVQPNSTTSQNLPLTIVLSGTGFTKESIALWNDEPLATAFKDANSLQATVPSRLVMTPIVARIAVSSQLDPTTVTLGLRFSVFSREAPRISALKVSASDLAWDAVSNRIYLAIANDTESTGVLNGVNPSTLKLEVSSPIVGQPSLISVSSSGKYLYIASTGSPTIERRDLPNLADDGTVAVKTDTAYITGYTSDLESSPVSDSTIAVARVLTGMDYFDRSEVSVLDDFVTRSFVLCGSFRSFCSDRAQGLFKDIQWSDAGGALYLADWEPSGLVLFSAPVTDEGVLSPTVHYTNSSSLPGGRLHSDGTSKLVYTDAGAVIDPVSGETVGNFPAAGRMVAKGVDGLAFFLVQSSHPNTNDSYTLEGFDLHTFRPICSITLPNVQGMPGRLIGWGNAGFAFNTLSTVAGSKEGHVYIVADEGDCKNWPSSGGGS